ncbi:MAG: hypothetical protein ACRENB_07370 [Gemmatimonadales bacterium]
MRGLLATALLLLIQADTVPRYGAGQLHCAVFRETVIGELRGRVGRSIRQERLGRSGVLVVAAAPADSALSVEVWYDSLSVWRETPAGREEADTEGLLGGRWVGRLMPFGRWVGVRAPFVPDEVLAFADLGPLLEDFFPRLPSRVLARGAADSSEGRALRWERPRAGPHRLRWSLRVEADVVAPVGDSLAAPLRQEIREEGAITWSPSKGPIGWERTVSTTVRPRLADGGSAGREAVVTQRIRVVRLPDRRGCELLGHA